MYFGYQVWTMLVLQHKQRSKKNLRDEGITRYDLGREKFVEETWKWKEEYAGHIRDQWSKLGLGLRLFT